MACPEPIKADQPSPG